MLELSAILLTLIFWSWFLNEAQQEMRSTRLWRTSRQAVSGLRRRSSLPS